jgi:hypothetical protein
LAGSVEYFINEGLIAEREQFESGKKVKWLVVKFDPKLAAP